LFPGGHQSFSASKQLNNAVGLVLHSIVLVPYHSWRISHSKHHAGTGHFERDEVFVPATRSEKLASKPVRNKTVNVGGIDYAELLEDAPIYRLYHILIQQVRPTLPSSITTSC
jgi:omega-6 fatty acid desaturase (delta-12 desaturase)